MTLLLEEPNAADEQRAQLLFKEARQRRRRLRFIWIAIVTTVVVSLISYGLILHLWSSSVTRSVGINTHPGWPAHLRTGATLVYAFNDLRVIDAGSGGSRVLPLPAPYGGSGDLGMVSIGNSLLLNRGNAAWLYSPGIDSAPADLGPSDGVFTGPSSTEAWIWSQPCAPILGCTNYLAPRMGSVQLIDNTGRKIRGPVTLPGDTGWYPMGFASTAGIVLAELPTYGDHSNKEEIWNPSTNQVVREFAHSFVIGASGNQIVWQSSVPYCTTGCSLHVLNVKTGSDRTVQLPHGVAATGAAISPDESTIAITAILGGASRVPNPQAIFSIQANDRVAKLVAGSEQMTNPNLGPMTLTWSANGWLFSFTVGITTVLAWRPGESRARSLPNLRLPKVSRLANEDPSLTAL
jgi:hypothetical protein